MKNKIERYGRKKDNSAILDEMPILGQRQINQPLNNFFLQHNSDQVQVTYVIDGCIDFTLDGCIYSVKKGDLILNKPGQVFGAVNETFPKSKSAFFKINLENPLRGWDPQEQDTMRQELQALTFPHLTPSKDFYGLFSTILNEHRNSNSLSSLKCRSLFQQLIIKIIEAHTLFVEAANFKRDTADQMINMVRDYVSKNLHRKIYTEEMAQVIGLSQSHFRYLFSLIFNTNPADYVLRRRIEKAKELLASKQSITAISYELAFSSSQYFSNSFKKLTGMRPKEYRNSLKNISTSDKIFGDQESSQFMDNFYQ